MKHVTPILLHALSLRLSVMLCLFSNHAQSISQNFITVKAFIKPILEIRTLPYMVAHLHESEMSTRIEPSGFARNADSHRNPWTIVRAIWVA